MTDLPDEDGPAYRALVLHGRIQALGEVSRAFQSFHKDVDADGDAESIALGFARSNQAFAEWLAEAGAEAASELQLLADQIGVDLPEEG